ncbi:flagellar biosynthesis protein FlhG [Paenibacillus phyllosphaerae]|uniref:Flagellar biosynthesis protein FlhG n=1 Tax=Paenibacillus phyllosphaerae TaxID=274593 RepID=A0A7W5AV75_9BACL|nr:MinD/ParA family protein [Paenibacillus phyllosphaerae]MBB3109410.1 flagellar biosynthesis protein FlhG [Paenibacillus phyllosphaerae]
MNDQAEALRHMVKTYEQQQDEDTARKTIVVTITSGKGGVGKSNFSLNFALALQQLGKKVLVFDADIGMANIDVLMGITAPYNLYHLLKQEKTIWDIVQEGPSGVHFIAGGSGFQDLLDLSEEQLNYFEEQIVKLHGEYDFILFDTGAGLSKETVKFIVAAQETVVVTTPEPTSITDAYALIKMVTSMDHQVNFKLVVNRAQDLKEGKATADKIGLVAQRFLGTTLPFLGIVQDDPNVGKSVKRQVPFSLAYPSSEATRDVMAIARQFCNMPSDPAAGGGVKGFIHKMFRRSK